MKTRTLLIAILLVFSLLLANCGSKEPTETTVNLPVVSGGDAKVTTEPTTVATEVQVVPQNTYPVGQAEQPVTLEAAITYPVGDDSSAAYAAEMRAFIEQILGGTMPIEDLFGKDDDVTRDILRKAAEGRLVVTEAGIDRAADWLKKQ